MSAEAQHEVQARQVRARFRALVRGAADDAIDLAEAALLIGAEAEPGTDLERWRGRLSTMGAEAAARVRAASGAPEQLRALCSFLYDDYGLRGNREAYYDPRNSYLHHVLSRGLGIPITLAVVVIEVGRRAGVPLVGVGFPAHFLVRHRDLELFIDPFDAGRALTVDGCRQLLDGLTGGSITFQERFLEPTPVREVLARMLRNLKAIHLQRGELDPALAAVERLLLLRPGDPEERRDRGLLRAGLRRYGLALPDLERYVAERPDAPDAARIRAQVEVARRALWTMN